MVKLVRIVLPGFEGKVDGGWQVFLLVVFRGAQVNEKTARVGRESMQVVDSQRVKIHGTPIPKNEVFCRLLVLYAAST